MTVRVRVPWVDDPDFVADVSYRGEGAVLKLIGSADRTATPAIGELLGKLHDELRERKIGAIVLDMHAVDYMHASCFKELLAWIARLQELPADDRYRIKLRSNPSILWQRHTLAALACFDTGILSVDEA